MTNVELFAGPGGFSLGARLAGVADPVGYEWDREACATARTAGHTRVRVDVATVDVHDVDGPVAGLIGSPPCQAWSRAGLRGARHDAERILAHLADVATAGYWIDYRVDDAAMPDLFGGYATDHGAWADPRSPLVLEMVRWQLALMPKWIACEQVPDVLPFWQAWGDMLTDQGYNVWTGRLRAEQYGVPQTRERSFLIAARGRDVAPPAPTHRRYVPGTGTAPGDEHLPRWLSMADALGWGMTERPYPTIASGRKTGGPDREKVGGSQARAAIYNERDAGRWVLRPGTTADDPVRLSLPEAAVLQGFPVDYPWTGTATARFRQIGDAVPPPLGAAVLLGLFPEA